MTSRIALATDVFNRSENPLGGGVWTTGSGDTAMLANGSAAVPTAFSGADSTSYYSGLNWPPDQYSQANLTVSGTAGSFAGMCLILCQQAGAATRYRFSADHAASNNIGIEKFIAGTPSTIAQATLVWVDGDLFRFEFLRGVMMVYKNNVLVLGGSDLIPLLGGFPGIGFSTAETSGSLDNWEGGLVTADVRDYSNFPKLPFAGVSKR